jgi:hypothetical protein
LSHRQNASEKSIGELVVAYGDAAVLLQGVEEALDEIALAVEGEVGLSRFFAVGFRRNDGRDPALLELLDEGVRVISLVADEGVRLDLVEKRRSLSDVGRLPRSATARPGCRVASTTAWIFDVRPPRERPMA